MNALRERNPARAREAMREHILTVKEKALGAAASGAPRPVAAAPALASVRRPRARSARK
jgi:hypothetical protein